MSDHLGDYNRKRDFKVTSEPQGEAKKLKNKAHALKFVIQKHAARRLHYDFRLEMDGTLKSWAVPKGPSLDPKDKRLAVHVEDHPLSYASFEGSIPHGQYGGGDVIVWDQGVWEPHGDPIAAHNAGKLKFTLVGEKLTGDWTLVKTHLRASADKEQWLLIKERDSSARAAEDYDVVNELPKSVLSGIEINSGIKEEIKPEIKSIKARSNRQTGSNVSSDLVSAIGGKAGNAVVQAKQKSKTHLGSQQVTTTLPEFLPPELATLVSEPPTGDWLYEIKFDGYRILARILNGEVRLFTRNGHDWTHKLLQQADAIAALKLEDSWLDGEVIVLDDAGLPSFQQLQNAFESEKSGEILYYIFDAPFLNGTDLRSESLEQRRAALERIVGKAKKTPLRFSSSFVMNHKNILASACAMSLEGIIGKRAGSPYVSKRSGDWIKLKCRLRQEFVIVGYTKPQGSRSGFGALVVAVHKEIGNPDLVYAGRIGTGFDANSLERLFGLMQKRQRETSPLSNKVLATQVKGVQWIEPNLICEAEFAQWTTEGILRQATFIALRTDKPVRDIIRERPRAPGEIPPPEEPKKATLAKSGAAIASLVSKEAKEKDSHQKEAQKMATGKKQPREKTEVVHTNKKSATENVLQTIKITHPDRVIDRTSGVTKKELAEFYLHISPYILPHLDNRPVSLLRVPESIDGEQFFQKHVQQLRIPNIKQLDESLDPGHAALMEIDSVEALVGATQMGMVELHTWGARVDKIEKPDRITLDLDPDPALPWRSLVEAAQLTLAVLDELKLRAFLKTTGGKGLHIVIPLRPDADWDNVKEFSKSIAQFMAHQIPERFVAKMGPKNRVGKIFIDYLRNQRGASAVSAYSVRARPGLPVSVPISRDELTEVKSSAQWNIHNLHERLDQLKDDPWKAYKNNQTITQVMWKMLEVRRS